MLLFLLLVSTQAWTQEKENVLKVGDFEGRIDKMVNVPVYLHNTDEVVALQFDVELPFAIPSGATASLSARSDQHSVSFSTTGTRSYRVVVMSMENRPLRGNSGLLLRLPMQAYDDGQTTTPYPITVSNVVLTDNQGNNIATSPTAQGNYMVNREPLPDLTVGEVAATSTQCSPGAAFSATFVVKNEGTGATRAGWTEKLYLESSTGQRTYIGSQSYVSTLAAGGSLQRTYEGTLPTLLHLDGPAVVVVEVVPHANCGELLADQGNNENQSATTIDVRKLLLLTADNTIVREGRGPAVLTLQRSGDWSIAETFTVNCSVDGLLTCNGMSMPCRVTIPARSSGATLRIAAVDDRIVRSRQADIIVAATDGYDDVKLSLSREENDRNPLSLNLSSETLAEGAQFTLVAERGGELTDELTVDVACSHANRFDQPFVVHFDPGQSSARATATAIDDHQYQLDARVTFMASATDYQSAKTSLLLTDADRPALTFNLSSPSILENSAADDEAQPVIATVSRDRGMEQEMTVWLTSSANEIQFEKNKVVIPAGEKEVSVPLSVTDNSRVDGQRQVRLTAALFLPADMKAAPTGDRANAQALLTVVDDELPYLTLSSRVTAVGEGTSALITVRRYVSTVSSPLSVMLACDDPRVSFTPQPVTIPAGSTQATATVKVARNSELSDDADILITATATDMEAASMHLYITDRTLPDAVCPTVEFVGKTFHSGLPATVRATIRNCGTSVLPKGMTIDFYLCSASQLSYYARSTHYFQATTDCEVEAGGEETFEFEAPLPQMVGRYWLYARLNADNNISEFSTTNNTTQRFCPIDIAAPFEVETIAVSPTDCLPGDIVTVKGRMKAVEGSFLNGQTVRVELKGNGQRTAEQTVIDTNGSFSVSIRVDRSASGYLTVNALALGQTEPAKTDRVHVYNMSLTAVSNRWNVDENIAQHGTLQLRNTSARPITFASLTVSNPLPDGMELTFTPPTGTIAAGSSVAIPYTVKGLRPSAQRQQFTFEARSQEGLVAQLPVSYYCQATNARLVFTPRELKTTMLFNADRENVEVTVKNCGKKTSGRIAELISDEWVMTDFGSNRTLAPGEQATIHLTFLAQDYMHTGRTYKSYLQLSPENGEAAGLPITVTTTGSEYGQMDLYATDVYALDADDFSHLAGGSVTITDARTKQVVMTGTLDNQGHWQTQKMEEGRYDVTVKAARHLSVTRQIAVGPGEDTEMHVVLPYRAVMADFVVDQNLADNTYSMQQFFDVDSQAPQAIVMAELADAGFGCGSETIEVVLRNVGSKAARNVRLLLPVSGDYTFTQLNAMPVVMQPGDVHVMQLAYEGPQTGTHRVISTLRLHYEFEVAGQTLSEDDNYQSLVGCTATDVPSPMPTVDPTAPAAPEDISGDDDSNGHDGDGDQPSGAGVSLPAYGGFATLQFENLNTLRCGQPLQAVLTVRNGQLKGALRNLRFEHQASDAEFEDASTLFTCTEGTATGFTADGDLRQIAAGEEGTLQLTFVPLTAAAAEGATTYYLGGQLSFTSDATQIRSTVTLPATQITVLPVGDVLVTCLIQRHLLSDDTQTDEVVESAEPAVFAMLVQNMSPVGAGQLHFSTSQPVVVGNTSARPVAYATQYAAVNGEEGNYVLSDFQLDSLAGGATAAARWIHTSSISAHVRSMQQVMRDMQPAAASGAMVRVGGVRELVRTVASRSVEAAATPADGDVLEQKIGWLAEGDAYLLNDVADEQSLPDAVLTASGEECALRVVTQQSTISPATGSGNYTLTVSTDGNGWIYGQLHDPTNGQKRLTSVMRQSDGRQLSLANFWQTDRTPQADLTMLKENLLHFADELAGSEETYLLHFEEDEPADVRLKSVRLFTADGTEVAHGSTTGSAVKRVEVTFTAPVKRLALNHMMFTAHGEVVSMAGSPIQSADEKTRWTVDLSLLPEVLGEHSFMVMADKVTTSKGGRAVGSLLVEWTEVLSGKAFVTVNVAPTADCGMVTPASGEMDFGQQTFKATPVEGYQFVYWTDEYGEVLSRENHLTVDIWKERTLTAHFAPQQCSVSIVCGDHGELKGYLTGIYVWGEQILLAAQPENGYLFDRWEKDGRELSKLQTTTDVVKGNHTYKAFFSLNPLGVSSSNNASAVPCHIYNLMGVRVASDVVSVEKALQSLPAGVYIVRSAEGRLHGKNGRKIVKK